MSDLFLRLDIDREGLTAAVRSPGRKQDPAGCRILFKDLDRQAGEAAPLVSAMAAAAEQIDLLPCTRAVIFFSNYRVFHRLIRLPFSSATKIRQVLPLELAAALPCRNETYIHDFYQVDRENRSCLILTASALESDIASCFNALEPHGIRPVLIAPKGVAAAAAFLESNHLQDSFVFIYTDDTETVIVLVRESKPCFVRQPGRFEGDLDRLAGQIKSTLAGFEQRTGLACDCRVIWCDTTGEWLPGACDDLESKLHKGAGLKQYQTGDDTGGGQVSQCPESVLDGLAPDKIPAFSFNFCQGRFRESYFFGTHARLLMVALLAALITFGLAVFSVHLDIKALEGKIAVTDQQAADIYKSSFPDRKKIIDPYLQMQAEAGAVFKKKDKSSNFSGTAAVPDFKVLDLIREISEKIPPSLDTAVSRLLFTGRQLVVSGTTGNFNDVDNIKSRLEASTLFSSVTISSAAADKKESRVKFKFIIDL